MTDNIAKPTPVNWFAWLAVFVCAMAFYGLTACSTIQWQDYGHFVIRILDRQLRNELGLALAHPLHYWIGSAVVTVLPVSPPLAVALVSAIFGSLTIANVFGIIRSITSRVAAATMIAAVLAVSNTFWRMSTHPECYTVTTAFLTLEVWCLVRFWREFRGVWLILAFGANGLGFANHNLALLTLPVIGVVGLWAWRTHRIELRVLLGAIFVWFIGSLPYTGLVAVVAAESGDFLGTIRSALVGNSYGGAVVGLFASPKTLAVSVAFTALSFIGPFIPLAFYGVYVGRRNFGRWPYVPCISALVIHLLFALRYDVIDQYTFLLPSYTLAAVFAGVGLGRLMEGRRSLVRRLAVASTAISVFLAPIAYVAAAQVARRFQAFGSLERHKPYRDDYNYLLLPWGIGKTSAARMSEAAVDAATPDGVIIVEDWMGQFAVRYEVWDRAKTGIEIADSMTDAVVKSAVSTGRRIVVVPRRTDEVPGDIDLSRWRREGELFILDP